MSDIRQCWAFNNEGQRCDHPAGHPGNHVVMNEWSDDDCFSPIRHQLPDTTNVLPPLPLEAPPLRPAGCTACSHNHKGGECKCGCYEFIG